MIIKNKKDRHRDRVISGKTIYIIYAIIAFIFILFLVIAHGLRPVERLYGILIIFTPLVVIIIRSIYKFVSHKRTLKREAMLRGDIPPINKTQKTILAIMIPAILVSTTLAIALRMIFRWYRYELEITVFASLAVAFVIITIIEYRLFGSKDMQMHEQEQQHDNKLKERIKKWKEELQRDEDARVRGKSPYETNEDRERLRRGERNNST